MYGERYVEASGSTIFCPGKYVGIWIKIKDCDLAALKRCLLGQQHGGCRFPGSSLGVGRAYMC